MVKISVIVPAYNTGKVLNECVESILKQDATNFEIIIVNDGSNSLETLDILSKYSAEEKIRIISIENSGVSVARNVGLLNASGQFIAFIDSDDIVSPKYLSSLVAAIEKTDSDISICNVDSFETDSDISTLLDSDDVDGSYVIYDSSEATSLLLSNKIKGYCPGKLFKKSILQEILFDSDLRIMEDFYFVNQAFLKCKKICVIDITRYFYRVNPMSATNSFNKEAFLSIDKSIFRVYCLNKDKLSKQNKRFLIGQEFSLLFKLACNKSLTKEDFLQVKHTVSLINCHPKVYLSNFHGKDLIKYLLFKLGRWSFCVVGHIFGEKNG